MWYGGGQPCNHSTLVVVSSTVITFRFEENASQIMNIIIITAIREIRDPIDEIEFHRVYASG